MCITQCVCVYLQSQINYTVHSFYISKEETIMKPGSLPFLPLDKALHQSASLTIPDSLQITQFTLSVCLTSTPGALPSLPQMLHFNS